MTLYLCQFIAIPHVVTLEEAVEWVAHRSMPLTIDPEHRDSVAEPSILVDGKEVPMATNTVPNQIYNSELDTPNFIGFSSSRGSKKGYERYQEIVHPQMVDINPAQAKIFNALSRGELKATGRLDGIFKLQFRGNTRSFKNNNAWIIRGRKEDYTADEKEMLSAAIEKWDNKTIEPDFWEVKNMFSEENINSAASVRYGVYLGNISLSTMELFNNFPPESIKYGELQLWDQYAVVAGDQIPHTTARKEIKRSLKKLIDRKGIEAEYKRLLQKHGHDKKLIQKWYELKIVEWYEKKHGDGASDYKKEVSIESVRKIIQALKDTKE